VNDCEVCNLYHSITRNRDAFRFSGAFRASQKLFRASQPHFGEYPLFSMPGFARDHAASRGPLLRPLTPRHLNRIRVVGIYSLEPSGGVRLGTFELRDNLSLGEKHNQIDQGQTAILCGSIEPTELARALLTGTQSPRFPARNVRPVERIDQPNLPCGANVRVSNLPTPLN
jgi:hypothetical protein